MTKFQHLLALMALVAMVSSIGCTSEVQPLEVEEGAAPFAFDSVSILGKQFKGKIATTTIERARLQKAINFNVEKEPQAAVFVYGGAKEKQLTLSPSFRGEADIIFANREGKVVQVLSGDHGYVPEGVQTSKTGNRNAPHLFVSDAPASVAIFASKGVLSASDINLGSSLKGKVTPDPFALFDKADPSGVVLYFRPWRQKNPDIDVLPDPIAVSARIAMEGESRAENLREGEDAVLLLYPPRDQEWSQSGFWLKGVKGKVSIAFMRLQAQGYREPNKAYAGAILDLIEGIEDKPGKDIDKPLWWPSREEVNVNDQVGWGRCNGPVNAVLVMRGEKAFSDKGISENMWAVSSPIYTAHPGQYGENLIRPDNARTELLSVNGKSYQYVLFAGNKRAGNSLMESPMTPDAQVSVLAFDDPDTALLKNPTAKSASVAVLKALKGRSFEVSSVETVEALGSLSLSGNSRFALHSTSMEFSAGQVVELPWQVANMKPVDLRQGSFFKRAGTAQEILSAKHFNRPPRNSDKLVEKAVSIKLEVADTDTLIAYGLKHRTQESLPKNQGMIFLFDDNQSRSFWMQDCLMDIDVAFIDKDFKIKVIHTMKKPEPNLPSDELELYGSQGPAKYAVEMRGGWFKENGFSDGDYLWIPITQTLPRSER